MEKENPTSSDRSVENIKRFYGRYRVEISAIIGYMVGILIMVIVLVYVILPEYTAINALGIDGTHAYAKMTTIRENGLSLDDFKSLARANKQDIGFLLQDKKLSESAIAKPKGFTGTYLDWVNDTIGHIDEFNAKNAKNDLAISEILPLYTSTDPGLDPNYALTKLRRMNTANFIEYIENNILRRFNLVSEGNIGISNLRFSDKDTSLLPIGTYQFSILFHGKNRDILRMLTYIQTTGTFSIQDRLITSAITSTVRNADDTLPKNLFLNIVAFSISKTIYNNDDSNNGSMTLETYVRGLSPTEIYHIRDTFIHDLQDFSKSLDPYMNICSSTTKCQDESYRITVTGIRSIQITVTEMLADPFVKNAKTLKKTDSPDKILQSIMKMQRSFDMLKSKMADYLVIINRKKDDDNSVSTTPKITPPNTIETTEKKPAKITSDTPHIAGSGVTSPSTTNANSLSGSSVSSPKLHETP